MVTVPSIDRLVNDTENLSNLQLEKAYRELSLFNGFKRFGRIKEVPETVEVEGQKIPYRASLLAFIRKILIDRDKNGLYYFSSRAERKRLQRVKLV